MATEDELKTSKMLRKNQVITCPDVGVKGNLPDILQPISEPTGRVTVSAAEVLGLFNRIAELQRENAVVERALEIYAERFSDECLYKTDTTELIKDVIAIARKEIGDRECANKIK